VVGSDPTPAGLRKKGRKYLLAPAWIHALEKRGLAIGCGCGIGDVADTRSRLLSPLLRITESTQINQLLQTPLWWRILSTVRAAVSEEVFYRGFGLQEVERLMGGKWIGAAVSLAFFTLAHAPAWGWTHLIPAFLGGLLLTLLFLRRRNLWVNMACHFLVDLTAVL
jgi:membrane protease YdiL (CAAX protease family)